MIEKSKNQKNYTKIQIHNLYKNHLIAHAVGKYIPITWVQFSSKPMGKSYRLAIHNEEKIINNNPTFPSLQLVDQKPIAFEKVTKSIRYRQMDDRHNDAHQILH